MRKKYSSFNYEATVIKSDYAYSNHTILRYFTFSSDIAKSNKENLCEIQKIKEKILKMPTSAFEKNTFDNLEFTSELSNYLFYVCSAIKDDTPVNYILKFLEYDFTKFQNYFSFFLDFGLLSVVSSISQNDLKKFKFLNTITLSELLTLAYKYYVKDKQKLISFQEEYNKTIQFIFNHNNDKDYNEFSPHNLLIIYELFHSTENTICKYRSNIRITEDIINMNDQLSHYTGLSKIPKKDQHQLINELRKLSKSNKLTLEYGKIYRLDSIFELMYLFLSLLISNTNAYIKKCKCCNKYFYTTKSNVTYCDRIQNKETQQTCKDIGPDIALQTEKKNNYIINLKASIASKKAMDVKRHPDIPSYKENYDTWKPLATQYLKLYKEGTLDGNTFEKWLKYSSNEKIKSKLKTINEL